MPIGWRQIVLMTHMADEWPEPISNRAMISMNVPGCEHPVEEVERNRNGIVQLEKQHQCHCWAIVEKIYRVFSKLAERDMIVENEPNRYVLTQRGWELLHKERRAPVTVNTWESDGRPKDYTVRRSKRAEFLPLYDHKESHAAIVRRRE